jgi:hypothetical protein
MNVAPVLRWLPVVTLLIATSPTLAQNLPNVVTSSQASPQPGLPVTPQPENAQLQTRPAGSAPPVSDLIAPNGKPYALVDGIRYQRPTSHDFLIDYLKDTYGLPALARTGVRALYAQARGLPTEWDDGWTGFGERFGSSAGVTIISGNVRYAMELTFKEDLRYYPCHNCSVKAKIENALLAEITARHDVDGHRFFTLTPTVADFSGPIIAHTLWYPGPHEGPLQGVISARTYFATRIGAHLFREFVMERKHKIRRPEPSRTP